jgi:conjugal transfer/entry exclusion protein
MRMFRVLVIGVLVAGGLAMVTPGASASVPALSKTCKALQSLDKSLNKVVTSSNYDSGTISNLAKSFRTAAKTAPKRLRSAMNEIAAVASDAASGGSTAAAAAALKKDAAKLSAAVVTWGTYLSTNCAGASSSTS